MNCQLGNPIFIIPFEFLYRNLYGSIFNLKERTRIIFFQFTSTILNVKALRLKQYSNIKNSILVISHLKAKQNKIKTQQVHVVKNKEKQEPLEKNNSILFQLFHSSNSFSQFELFLI